MDCGTGDVEREAILYEKLSGGKIGCRLCPRGCRIPEGSRGYCGVRENRGGRLYSLIYGEVASISLNPIEKKPVFHFFPGTYWLSLGTWGCNFRCPGCQNWELSFSPPRKARFIPPAELVNLARRSGAIGISWTFNEPTIWIEYIYEGMTVARENGLYTNLVTNGYISTEALELLLPLLDVYRVDIKGFSRSSYARIAHISDPKPIFAAVKRARERGVHVELVTNVIPGYNDEDLEAIARWIFQLDPLTPWHITRFFPHLHLSHVPPSPIPLLEQARTRALELGLKYVYLGNVPGHPGEDTYCHSCGRLLIRREIFSVKEYYIKGNSCPYCGTVIPGCFSGRLPHQFSARSSK